VSRKNRQEGAAGGQEKNYIIAKFFAAVVADAAQFRSSKAIAADHRAAGFGGAVVLAKAKKMTGRLRA
jgi:hypothetical protein